MSLFNKAMQDSANTKEYTFRCGKQMFSFRHPWVMGIVNLTPDSFFSPSRFSGAQCLQRVGQMLSDGANIIDLGAQSTRPGAIWLDAAQEWQRLEAPLKQIRAAYPETLISVDTFHAEVAERAVCAGANIINDVSGGEWDEAMFITMARLQVPYILTHSLGKPQVMQDNPQYANVAQEVIFRLASKIRQLHALGIADIWVDPGFGFGKQLEHNYQLLEAFTSLHQLQKPVLAGVSRKSMVYKVLGIKADDALNGSTFLHSRLLEKGVHILRVHDVKQAVEAVRLHTFAKHTAMPMLP